MSEGWLSLQVGASPVCEGKKCDRDLTAFVARILEAKVFLQVRQINDLTGGELGGSACEGKRIVKGSDA